MTLRRPRRSLVVSVVAAVLFPLASAGCDGPVPSGPSSGPTTSGTTSSGPTTSRTTTSTSGQPAPSTTERIAATWATERAAAAQELLRARLAAQAGSDRAGWLARVSGDATRTAQGAVFDRMQAIRVRDLALDSVTEVVPPIPAAPGTPVTWDVRAVLTYRIDGFQTASREFTLDLSLRADPAQPDDVSVVDSRPGDRIEPWDLNGLRVRRTAHALVLGVESSGAAGRTGAGPVLDEVSARAESAHQQVAGVWGSAPPAVWVVPGSDADAARLLGTSVARLAGVSAVTDGPLTAGQRAGADRVVVVPGPWATLTGEGHQVVLTHELTHVAVRATTTRAVPLWLSEGFAEYVAYRPVALPEAAIVRPLLDHVRSAGVPQHLPGPEEFDPANGRLSAAYGMALAAARTLADHYGRDGLVRVYRAAAGGLAGTSAPVGDADALVYAALSTTLHTTRAALERDWRARISRLAQG